MNRPEPEEARYIALGQRNAEIIDLFQRFCGNIRVEVMGGTGMLEAATGLPIGGGPNPGRLTIAIYGPSRPQSGPAVQSVEVDAEGRFRMRAAPGVNYPYIMQPDFNQRIENQNLRKEGVEVKAGEKTTVEFRIRPAAQP